MSGLILLAGAAMVLRSAGAMVRSADDHAVLRVGGWLLCAAGLWLAAGAAGAWSPLWPVVLLGAVGGLTAIRFPGQAVRSAGDAAIVLAAGLGSVPPLGPLALAGLGVMVVTGGLAIDRLAERLPRGVRWTAFAGPAALGVLLVPAVGYRAVLNPPTGAWYSGTALIHLGVSGPEQIGRQVKLKTGDVAWLATPQAGPTHAAALVFHGADPAGSGQPAARALRRALLAAGYTVLLVDHPGFGHSPAPEADAPLEAWDPLPTGIAAAQALRDLVEPEVLIVIGHSMGASDALRLMHAEQANVSAVVLFGAALGDSKDRDDYWHRRFHTDRGLPADALSAERVLAIRRRYYSNAERVRVLEPGHPPIVFVRFGTEHANLVPTRDALYEQLPDPKRQWTLPRSTHYFSSTDRAGLLIGDVRVTRALAARLRELRQQLEADAEIAPGSDAQLVHRAQSER